MFHKLPPAYLQLVWEALHRTFWRRQSLHDFLRRSGIKESFLASWTDDESKRDFLNRLFPRLESTEQGVRMINAIADSLSEMRTFPDLENWEESKRMKAEATQAVAALRLYVAGRKEEAAATRATEDSRRRAAERREQQVRQQHDLTKLNDRLNALASQLGTQEGGYAFQAWFYDLVAYFELVHRRSFNVGGRNIDGSVTAEGTTYLVELKFTSTPTSAPEVDTFRRKVETKADNTMGVMVSVSGYSEPAMTAASGDRSPILLLAHQHLYAVLGGALKLGELVNRVRRHASQTGRAFVELDDL